MIVYYRLCAIKSGLSKPPPIYADDIYKLTELCLKSFIEAFRSISPKMVFIADYCGPEYEQMVEELVPFDYEYRNTAFGINETCLLQYSLFEKSDEDVVLFQEYDYMWVPNTGHEITEAVTEFDFVTPYDHPDKYKSEKVVEARVIGNRYWKPTASTTATFATTRPAFDKYKDIFYKHGYIDHARWTEIAREGGKLYSPLPSIATHLVAEYMAPHIQWLKTTPPSV